MDIMNMTTPTISIRATALFQLSGSLYRNGMDVAIIRNTAPAIGRLRKHIQRQLFSAINPPRGGPAIEPKAAIERRMLRYLLRSRRVTRSHSMTSINNMTPPLPRPCVTRPDEEQSNRRQYRRLAPKDIRELSAQGLNDRPCQPERIGDPNVIVSHFQRRSHA